MMTQVTASYLHRVFVELGLHSLFQSSKDATLLYVQRFVRLFAYGASTLILVLFLSSLHISDARIGLFMTLTLLGDVVISFLLTLFADRLGRRRTLALGAGLMCASGLVFSFSGNYWILVAASILGVITPSGNEIGPFRAIEESTLAQLTPIDNRSDIFAWYTLIGTAGTACGTIICGWITQTLRSLDGWTDTQAYRVVFVVYALLGIVKLFVSLMLSDKCEVLVEKHERQDEVELGNVEAETLLDEEGPREESKPAPNPRAAVNEKAKKSFWPHINPESRSILLKLCLLFAIDSTASGLVPSSWITSFFNRKFSLAEGKLGTIFFATNIVSAASNLVASSMAKRIGLIKTMVFTHLPSAICLTLIPLPSVLGLAITLLILRSSTQSMDQAPRQAFLAAAVLPSERTAVMGVVNVVKTLSQSAGPVVTGWLAGSGKFWIVFVVAGAMKATYDLSMLKLFLGYKTQESRLLERQERESTDSDANA